MVMVKKNEITVSTRMEKQDYKRFLLENAYKISTVSTLVGRLALALIITLLVRNALHPSAGVMVAVFAASLALLFAIQRFELELQYRMNTDHDPLQQFGRWQTLHFGRDGVVIHAQDVKQTGEIPYEKLIRVAETGEYFYLYMSRKAAAIVRKKDMKPTDAAELATFLKEKMNPYYICRC